MRHRPSIGAVLGAPVCVEGGVLDALLTKDFVFKEPRWKFPAGSIEPDEQVLEALGREMKEETGLDLNICWMYGVPIVGRIDIAVEEMEAAPVLPDSDQIQYRYCIKVPRREMEQMDGRFRRGVGERILCKKFRLRRIGSLSDFLPQQRPFFISLLQHLLASRAAA